jgi:hypothetical protein
MSNNYYKAWGPGGGGGGRGGWEGSKKRCELGR